MKTGIELIAQERQKQIDKHGFTGKHHSEHPEWYDENQLTVAASAILLAGSKLRTSNVPKNWDAKWWEDLCNRPNYERLIIAGALLAAEIDRIQYIDNACPHTNTCDAGGIVHCYDCGKTLVDW